MLRPWAPCDAPAVLAAFSAPDVQQWHLRTLDDEDEAPAWVTGWERQWRQGSNASWAITTPGGSDDDGDGEALGQVGLRDIHLGEGGAEVSYWVTPGARGRHLAARATGVLTAWALASAGLHRLWLMHSTRNDASCAAATHAGFTPEGTLRGHLRHADGWHDMHVHGRLSTDRRPSAAEAPSGAWG